MPEDLFLRCGEEVKKRYLSFPGLAREYQATLEDESAYCALDFETTGLDPRNDRVIEVAAVRVTGGAVTDRLHSLIDPGMGIPRNVRLLTGITDEMVSGAPGMDEYFPELAEFLGDLPVVAYSRLEEGVLRALYAGHSRAAFRNPYIDAMDLAVFILPCLRSHRQVDLASIWELTSDRAHRAEDDVEALVGVYEILLNGLYNAPLPLIKAVADHAPAHPGGFSLLLKRVLVERTGGRTVDRLDLVNSAGGDGAWERIPPLSGGGPPGTVSAGEVRSIFERTGPLARIFDDYEGRDEQLEMAEAVRRAFESGEILLVEAGTGTGKSLAYLAPAVLHSRVTDLPVVVSTKTLNLQDQLFTKDLPLLEDALGDDSFRYAVLKGYGNYVCLRRLQALLDGRRNLAEEQLGILGMILTWITEGGNGDVSLLNVQHLRGLADTVIADYRECPGDRCRFAKEGCCYYRRALYRAKRSHVVVVNHSLLLTGVNLPFVSAVIDEAHTLEDVATEQFTAEFDYAGVRRFLCFLRNPEEGTGYLADLPNELSGKLEPKAADRAGEMAKKAGSAVEECLRELEVLFLTLSEFYAPEGGYDTADVRFSDAVTAEIEYSRLQSDGMSMLSGLGKLASLMGELKAVIEGLQDPGLESTVFELEGHVTRLADAEARLELTLDAGAEGLVHWATASRPERLAFESLKASPIDVGPMLAGSIYEQLESLVMTSATLTVSGSFEFFRSRIGLDLVAPERVRAIRLESSFDYSEQMQILVLHDMPSPRSRDYYERLADVLGEVIRAADGGVLALFTNRRLMLETYETLAGDLEREGLTLLCQQPGYSRRRLAEQFVSEERSSLFGTASFWEGVDASGDTLRLVVVTRIPFETPGRPVFEARSERLKREGLSDFSNLSLPLAALKLKQGVGRLIRTRQDRGQILIVDSRIDSQDYGRVLLQSLPGARRLRVSMDGVGRAVSDFRGSVTR